MCFTNNTTPFSFESCVITPCKDTVRVWAVQQNEDIISVKGVSFQKARDVILGDKGVLLYRLQSSGMLSKKPPFTIKMTGQKKRYIERQKCHFATHSFLPYLTMLIQSQA